MDLWIPVLLALAISFIHLAGERFNEDSLSHERFWTSLSAGVTVTYLFLVLLPELHQGAALIGSYEFVFALIGFSTMYISKEVIYSRVSDRKSLRKDFKELHTVFLSGYYLCIGALFYMLSRSNTLDAYLLFIPIALHTGFSSLSMKELHEDILDSTLVKISVSFSVLLGVITARLLQLSEPVFYSALGLISGMFFYVVLHDSLKPERDHPAGYVFGVLVYSAILILIWSI